MAVTLVAQAEAAQRHLADCHLCPHHCGERRRDGTGVCRVGQESFIASEMMHMGEEALLRPAHAIFFSGCTATCSFCTAAKFAFRPTYGVTVTPEQLATRIVQRQAEGARAICFIGGDPTPHIPYILSTLATLGSQQRIPAVLNSNFYLTPDALALLDGAIDIYLPDLKFGPATGSQGCGERIGGMPDYWVQVTAAIEQAARGRATVIVRHLLMPGHFDCCTAPVLAWLAQRPALQVSLLTQYLAPAHAHGVLADALTTEDVDRAERLARTYGLRLVE